MTAASIHLNPSKSIRVIVPSDDTLYSNTVFKLDSIRNSWVACGSDLVIDLNKYISNNKITNILCQIIKIIEFIFGRCHLRTDVDKNILFQVR